MTKPNISIIIPVYNVEPYLAKCLDSACGQTLKNIEILIVNDCSPDNSEEIIKHYMAKDPRIKYIKHEENLGLGGARNTGIANATGDYQWHIDSDDFIGLDACEFLYNTVVKTEVEVLCFSGLNYFPSKALVDNYFARDRFICNKVMSGIDFMARARKQNVFYCAVWLNLYKETFIKSFSERFQFRLNCAHQDTDYTPILYAEAQTVMCLHYAPYYRQVREDSITGVGETKQKMEDKLAVTDSLLQYIIKKKITFDNPLCEFAFKDFNYFFKVYKANYDTLNNNYFRKKFTELREKFEFIKHNYGVPFG